ncbi:MAG: YgfZ/GcvT domain-containing protein [Myxococcota bacterium]
MDIRQQAFAERLDGLGATWTTWREAEVVEHFGDPDSEYRSVVEGGVGLIDFAARDTLVVTGTDTVPWLQGLVTNDLMELQQEGAGHLTTVVNAKGRLVAEMRLLHMPDMFVADLEYGNLRDGCLSHLRHHVITEDVQLHDRSESTAKFGLFGDSAASIFEQVATWDRAVGDLDPFHGTWGSLDGLDVVVQRCDWTGQPGFLLSCGRSVQLAAWNALYEFATAIGHDTFETLRIEAGVPRYGGELDDAIIPLEAQLDDTIAYDKGCYLGQEIIARLDTLGTPAKMLRTLVFDGGAAPTEGAKLQVDGRKAGFVASSVWSPRLKAPIALAYVKRKYNDIGDVVQVEGREATVQSLGYPLSI